MRFTQQAEISRYKVVVAEGSFSGDGAKASMCILKVWSGVAFERGHGFHVEGVIVYPEIN